MKVLLVDDEDDIRRIGRICLEAVGRFETTVAASAAEAIRMAENDVPDLVLMDMMMPGTDGLAAMAAMRRMPTLAAVPVIFMTAKVQRRDVESYLNAGAAGVIEKPFDPMKLAAEIRAILVGHAKT